MNMFLSRELLRRSFGILIVCVAGCAGLIFSASAHAAACTITMPSTISFGSVTVPRNAPVGTPIGPLKMSSGSWSCPANPGRGGGWTQSGFYLTAVNDSTVSPFSSTVWNTGIPGIGIIVIITSNANTTISGTNNNVGSLLVDLNTTEWDSITNQTSSGSFTITYQLVTTGQVTGAANFNIPLFSTKSNDVAASPTTSTTSQHISATVTIVASTCTVTTPSISVTLPTVTAKVLSPVGTTAGNTAFSIGLSCQAGANVYVSLTDMTNIGNTTSNLTLASGSTATGVKLRVLKSGGSPVSYGPDSAVAGNQNQWLVGASASTTNIPLSVQYISTGTVGPGIVKGNVTFTMSYQ